MKKYTIGVISLAVLALTGCAGMGAKSTGQAENSVTFAQALAQNYSVLSEQESKKLDVLDAQRFAKKAKMANKGKEVLPDELASLDLEEDDIRDLRWGRARLIRALNQSTKTNYAGRAAQTQMLYDCWLDGVEEQGNTDDMRLCRMNFLMELSELENRLAPAPIVAAPQEEYVETYSGDNVVYFGTDRAALEANEKQVVDNIINIVQGLKTYVIHMEGHTDREASAEYNIGLSKRRVDYVAGKFIERGIDPNTIEKEWFGETRPAKPTEDDVRERLNRRVEVSVRGTRDKQAK